MDIAVIGTGYVGLVTGACLADFGHTVCCVDTNAARIEMLTRGDIPFYEPGLSEIVTRQVRLGRLRFTTTIGDAMETALVAFLAVGTPEGTNGEADLSQVIAVAESLVPYMDRYRVIVTKSTVPVGTGRLLREEFRKRLGPDAAFDIVSNPEFLREGSAVSDFLRPDRVVVGAASERAAAIMREIYRPLYLIETPIIMTDLESAETIKHASNAFLAVKISFMNGVANLCDRTGADVHVVAKGMGLDKRIGSKFLHPGPGFGGSCFPKDTRALVAIGERYGARQPIVEAAILANERQRELAVGKIAEATGGLKGRRIAVLGLSFKPNTSDVRESPALHICRAIRDAGGDVQAYDPVAIEEARHLLEEGRGLTYCRDAYAAADRADALVIVTEWNEFRNLDLERLRGLLRGLVIVDLRNVLDPAHVRAEGFEYYAIGRQHAGALPAETRVPTGASP